LRPRSASAAIGNRAPLSGWFWPPTTCSTGSSCQESIPAQPGWNQLSY
jgi:hypothetical protein